MWQVIGQPRAVELLERSLKKGSLAHAYLFEGRPHTGKMTMAINLAQALNCEQENPPCGLCQSCSRIAAMAHSDVRVIRRQTDSGSSDRGPKKEITVQQIRELREAANLRAYEGKHRIFIIEDAEHMNDEAANCLLKTLEEPPSQVSFILLTSRPERLLPTIVSRCQRVELFPMPAASIEKALVERWKVTPDKAALLSRLCNGRIGWAISASDDEELLQQRSSELAELQALGEAALSERFAYATQLATQYSTNRESVHRTLNTWSDWWRDLLLTKGECSEAVVNVDQSAALQRQSNDWSLGDIRGFIESIQATWRQLEQNANPRLALEVLVLSLPSKQQKVNVTP